MRGDDTFGLTIKPGPWVYLLVLLVSFWFGPTLYAAADSTGTIDPAAVDRFLNTYLAGTGLPGAAVAITRGNQIVHVAGFGQDARGKPVTADTRIPIASLSKSFTAMAVMQLVEAGRISLDDPVHRHLPEFTLADERAARITIRQLLNHTSGMADTEFREKSISPPRSLEEGVAQLRTARLAGEPGTGFHYHNPNYWVAARLVEVVSGESFGEYMRRHVLDPAGMTNTSTVGSLKEIPELAHGHIRLYGRSVSLPEPEWYLEGSSGIVTTARDLTKWLMLQNGGGVAQNGNRLVSAGSLDTLHAQHLGWAAGPVSGSVAHGGWLFTFTARQVLLPESGYGIVVVANRGVNLGPDDSDEIMRGLVALAEGNKPESVTPVGKLVDLVFIFLTLFSLILGVASIRRSRKWAQRWQRRPTFRSSLVMLAWVYPIVFLLGLREMMVFVSNGRDGTWLQILYFAPALVIWLAVFAAFGMAVLALRGVYLVRLVRNRE